jgi:hypothetical protein
MAVDKREAEAPVRWRRRTWLFASVFVSKEVQAFSQKVNLVTRPSNLSG